MPDQFPNTPQATPPADEGASPAQSGGGATPPVDDPLDLGDTDLHLQHPEPPAAEQPRDPVTGQFLKSDAAPSARAEVPAPKHPAWLSRQAEEMGLDPDLTAKLDVSDLSRLVNHQLRQQLALRAQFETQRVVQEGQVQPPPPKEDEFDLGEEGKLLDPEFAKVFREIMAKHVGGARKKVAELEAKLEAQHEETRRHRIADAADLIDAAFARLGAPYERFFGKGGHRALRPDSPEFRRRLAVLADAGIDVTRPDRAGIVGKLRAAADTLYAPPPVSPPSEGGSGGPANPYRQQAAPRSITTDEWDSAAVQRPTHRNGAQEPQGDALAVTNLTRRMSQAESVGDAGILDGIPD